VEAISPVRLYDVPEEVATKMFGVQEVPAHWKIVYPATPDPPLSVEAVHERLIWEAEIGAAVRFVGEVGVEASTATVTIDGVLVPVPFTAVKIYVVAEVGFTIMEPTRVLVEKLPGVIATDEALFTLQKMVLVPATATIVGDAEKEETIGLDPLLRFTVILVLAVFPFESVVTAQRVVDPLAKVAVFHGME